MFCVKIMKHAVYDIDAWHGWFGMHHGYSTRNAPFVPSKMGVRVFEISHNAITHLASVGLGYRICEML